VITEETAKAWRSSRRGKRYLTKRAAINAETVEIIKARYPTEPYEADTGAGFHWRELPRANVIYRRLRRLVARAYQCGES